MTDILKRLREQVELGTALEAEAANEIERLRAALRESGSGRWSVTDIVERLRVEAKDWEGNDCTYHDLFTQAADEVERLTRRIEQLEFIIADMGRRRGEA